jgi:hypothetical protein
MASHEHQVSPQGGAPSRLHGAVDSVLTMSAGAGLAVVAAYLFSRGRRHGDMVERLERLEQMVKHLEERGGAGAA